jgi:branched-chain amino acid transport system substrate-binding protein
VPGKHSTCKIGGAINCNFEMGSAISSDKVPKSRAFTDAYEKNAGVPIEAGHGISPSYESVYHVGKEAIERAGSVDADAIVAELEKADPWG